MISKKDTTVVIADDHPMLLNGLYQELQDNGYQVLGKASDGMQAFKLLLEHRPQIALLDIDMPIFTGLDLVKMSKEKKLETKFIVLSFHKESTYVSQAKSLNIDGYLLKEDSFLEIERCIATVLSGGHYFSKSFKSETLTSADNELKRMSRLSPSELKILKLIAQQYANGEIAAMLSVSIRTVEKHRSNMIAKLELFSETNALTNWALINQKLIMEQ